MLSLFFFSIGGNFCTKSLGICMMHMNSKCCISLKSKVPFLKQPLVIGSWLITSGSFSHWFKFQSCAHKNIHIFIWKHTNQAYHYDYLLNNVLVPLLLPKQPCWTRPRPSWNTFYSIPYSILKQLYGVLFSLSNLLIQELQHFLSV